MSAARFTLIDTGDEGKWVTVLVPGHGLLSAAESHPNFTTILDLLLSDEDLDPDEFARLFDVSVAVAEHFENLSERVSVSAGRVFFDGDEQHDAITKQIVRFLDEDVQNWVPLVNFMEKVASNPVLHSREQLYDWLNAHDFTLTRDGNIVGYKGVVKLEDGTLVSQWTGRAIVDGQRHQGQIPNAIGTVIEMPRSEVAHDPAEACSTGLHVGTYGYAESYARGAMLEVEVNPRDVVSVPTDAAGEKVRVCRYRVLSIIDAPHTAAVLDDEDDDYDGSGPFGF